VVRGRGSAAFEAFELATAHFSLSISFPITRTYCLFIKASSAYPFRRYSGGVRVWSAKTNRLEKWTWDGYAPRLVRAVRNSAHGLMEAFDRGDFAPIIVTHTGQMPAQLPDLAGLIAIALVADAERLCSGTWLD
jgi:hypothetical protein